MSKWMDNELDYRQWSEKERSIFDAGSFLGWGIGWWCAVGANRITVTPWEVITFVVGCAIIHYLKLIPRMRRFWDTVEATVTRWAGR